MRLASHEPLHKETMHHLSTEPSQRLQDARTSAGWLIAGLSTLVLMAACSGLWWAYGSLKLRYQETAIQTQWAFIDPDGTFCLRPISERPKITTLK